MATAEAVPRERVGKEAESHPSRKEHKSFLVTMARGNHPFPSRTRQLSPSAPMVLVGRPAGRVGRCQELILNPDLVQIRVFVLLDNIFCKPGSIKIGPGFMVLG